MRLLLDTSTFLWATLEDPRLSTPAQESLADPENELFLSPVSAWEIAVKHARERLALPEAPAEFVRSRRRAYGIRSLAFDEEAALHVPRLPWLHKDPFDRMLVCQAIIHQMALVTNDSLIAQYPVRVVW